MPVIEHAVAVYKIWHECRNNFPKNARYTLGERIDFSLIDTLELLFTASYQGSGEKVPTLFHTLKKIDTAKFLLRVAWELRALDTKRYAALSEKVHELGRMVGGWKRGLESKTPPKGGGRKE